MTIVAHVWIVVDEDKTVHPLTISGTRRAAIVNWLLSRKNLVITPVMDDEQIEKLWNANRGNAEIETVAIR